MTTKNFEPLNSKRFNHYVHVLGETEIEGDLNIESSQNIHIGNYDYDAQKLLPGNLKVGGDINAHTTAGHITTTINTSAKNVNFNAEKYNDGTRDYGGNILSDGKAVITADTYKFKSAGYIGGLKETNGHTVDTQIIDVMEGYKFIPADIESHDYLTINGGTITKIETPKTSANGNDVQVYIKSNNDVVLTGANAGDINITANRKRIDVQGPNVHAKNINVGPETDYLKVEFEGRDFTTNYTNIRDGKVVTIKPDEKITYELADGGYNQPTLKPTETKTYLIGPDKKPGPGPNPNPNPNPNPPNDDNVRVKNWVPQDPMAPAVNTPIAYAADLDDDEPAPCRKNVDGSVTVVRAYPMAN